MSSVRMCDRCKRTFSELEEGWQTLSGSVVRTNPITGKRETQTIPLDACPECAVGSEMIRKPILERLADAIERNPDALDRLLEKASERENAPVVLDAPTSEPHE